jgi:hypothetical protein
LQESLELSLIPRVIEELLGRELVIASPSVEGPASPPITSEPVVVVLPPPPAALAPSVMDACLEPLVDDNFPMSEIRLHIAINVVSRLNAAEVTRSLMVEEVSLREFLLDQILFLQESLEPSLVPHIIEELLGRELVVPLPRSRTSLVLQW